MCGIVGYVGPQEVVPLLIDGLKRLEYRGYDSAGVVALTNGSLATVKAEGKLDRLVEKLEGQPLAGRYGLGHTRWATHGAPIERNAHPVTDTKKRVAIIHNGIIENFLPLKQRLQREGWEFTSDTDTEVVANLISAYLETAPERGVEGDALLRDAVTRAAAELEGMYALAVVSTASPEEEIFALRHGPPLVLGPGEGEQFLASDPAALLAHTREVVFLENDDVARLTPDKIELWHRQGTELVPLAAADRPARRLDWDPIQTEKGGYRHFMLKEIHEQPQALQDTFAGRVDFEAGRVDLDIDRDLIDGVRRLHLLACGTSWHAGLVGKFLIEEIARLPVEVDYGSEYRYRHPVIDEGVLAVGISQSGETADTLAAMEAAQERGARLVSICNVPGSQATRISQGTVLTNAGPEIGVASTKAFTTQLVALYLLALRLAQIKQGPLDPRWLKDLAHLPQAVAATLELSDTLEEMARHHSRAEDFLFLGRGINYPIALEGALKLKEISYIHAEGYPAGEMKHGPIALIDEELPVVAIATGDRVFDKVKSNIQQVKARDGIVIALTDRDPEELGDIADEVIPVPRVAPLLQPVINVVPLQLLSYFIGVRRGCDVDQPRNLAKSVTVE